MDVTSSRTPGTAPNSDDRYNAVFSKPDYVKTLLNLSETDQVVQVKQLFDHAVKQCPMRLFLTLTNSNNAMTECQLYCDTVATLGSILLSPHSSATLLSLWKEAPQSVVKALREMYFKDRSQVSVILEAAHVQNASVKNASEPLLLTALLDSKPLLFAIDVAVLAAQRQFLNLERWLTEKLAQNGASFVRASVNFLYEKAIHKSAQGPHSKIAVSDYIMQDFVRTTFQNVFGQCRASFPTDVVKESRALMEKLNLQKQGQQPSTGQVPCVDPQVQQQQQLFKQAEERGLMFVDKVFSEEVTPEFFVGELVRLSRSPHVLDKYLSTFCVKTFLNSFSSLTLMQQKNADIYSKCFGLMLNNNLAVGEDQLARSLNNVLEAFQKEDPVLNRFGIIVLDKIQTLLPHFQQFCVRLAAFPTIQQLPSPLRKIVLGSANQSNSGETENSDVPAKICNELRFEFNNITTENVDEKVERIKNVCRYLKKFPARLIAQEFILISVSNDESSHDMYEHILHDLRVPELYDECVVVAVQRIKEKLSTLQSGDSKHQDVLRNLGHWVGRLTLARNKPVPANLPLKALLQQSMSKDKDIIHTVTVLVTAVLSHAANSIVFRPPNPWIVPLLQLLAKTHEREDVKMYTKFAIEELFDPDCLKLNIEDFKPVLSEEGILRERVRKLVVLRTLERDYPQFVPQQTEIAVGVVVWLVQRIRSPAFVQRIMTSVGIARSCVYHMVMKDWAFDPDEERLQRAAESMMICVLENHIEANNKELLHNGLVQELKKGIEQYVQFEPQQAFVDQLVQLIVPDLDGVLMHFLIEEGRNMAIKELKAMLIQSVRARQQYKVGIADGSIAKNLQFQDSQFANLRTPSQRLANAVPLSNAQTDFYINFAATTRKEQQAFAASGTRSPTQAAPAVVPPGAAASGRGQQGPGAVPTMQGSQQSLEVLIVDRLNEMKGLMDFMPERSLAECQKNHEIHKHIHLVVKSMQEITVLDEWLVSVVHSLYSTVMDPANTLLVREVYGILLHFLESRLPPNEHQTIFSYYSEESLQRKLDPVVMVNALEKHVIPQQEVDAFFASLLRDRAPNDSVVHQLLVLLQEVYARSLQRNVYPQALTREDLPQTFDVLHDMGARGLLKKDLQSIVEAVAKQLTEADSAAICFGKWCELLRALLLLSQQKPENPAQQEQLRLRQQQLQAQKREFAQRLVERMMQMPKTGEAEFRVFTDCAVAHAQMACVAEDAEVMSHVAFLAQLLLSMLEVVAVDPTADQAAAAAVAASKRSMLLGRALSGFVLSLSEQHRTLGDAFDQRPYQRLLELWLECVCSNDAIKFDPVQPPIMAFCHLLKILNPNNYPGFAFAWLDLLSHRLFLPQLLGSTKLDHASASEQAKNLLVELVRFMAPELRAARLFEPMRKLYVGTLRLFLAVLFNHPSLFAVYHMFLCDVIPPNCVQLRNLVLSAVHPAMTLPHFMTPNLKIDQIPEMKVSPQLPPHCVEALESAGFLGELDTFLYNGVEGPSFRQHLLSALTIPTQHPQHPQQQQVTYNVPAINALVLECAIAVSNSRSGDGAKTVADNAFGVLVMLLQGLDGEGRTHVLNAMANQLRFPSTHTLFYVRVLLRVFESSADDAVKSLLLRTVLERLQAQQPQPWGLLVLFHELDTDPRYRLRECAFVRADPNVRQLLERVSKFQRGV